MSGEGEPLWQPAPERAARSRMAAFATAVGLPVEQRALWEWSIARPGDFWRAVWKQCGVRGDPGRTVLVDGDRMPGARWFPEGRLSFAGNLLQREDDAPAVVWRREDGARGEVSFAELRRQVRAARAGLRALGVGPGDRVAAMLPNVPEAVVAMLATTALGAVWSSCSPDFGAEAVVDRFAQVQPKVLVGCDGHWYRGRRHDDRDKLWRVAESLSGLASVVVVPTAGGAAAPGPAGVLAWGDVLGDPGAEEPFAERAFDRAAYVLFSSGTTGPPKCIVHGGGGTLLQHRKEHALHCDLGPDDRLLYFTTTGWMMWNWMVSALAGGTAIVLYDGSPFHPGPGALWDVVQDERVTVFGTSAKHVDACKKEGLVPRRSHDLSAVRSILSTGSPLAAESFRWVYDAVKEDVHLSPISGGTDIVSCFALGSPLLPVRAGEMQCRGLGMRVEVWSESGEPLVGRAGELVCTAPFPSMPLGFLGDDGARYRAAYFEHFPNVWRHGDWATLTEHGGVVVHGRSDTTLNPGGVRIGTAEIYRQVEQIDEVRESLAVGQDVDGDQRIVLFVVLREGQRLDEGLRERIRRRVREGASPRHVPAVIAQVGDLPRTRSGKITETAVRDVVRGRPVRDTGALANPEALEQFRDHPDLRR